MKINNLFYTVFLSSTFLSHYLRITTEEPKAQPQVQTTSRYYSQAIQTAQEAYKAHQGAKRLSDYSTAINMLRQAVSLLENIDSQDSNYRLAQSKIKAIS